MRAVNLLPRDAYAPKQRLPYAPIVLAATAPVLAGALVYMGYSLEHSKVSDRRIELNVVESQVAALRPSANLALAASTISSQRAARELELSDALGQEVAWDVTFDQISRVLPANAWLTALTAQSLTGAAAAAPTAAGAATAVEIVGDTYTVADVAHVLSRIALVPNLTGVTLASATASQTPDKTQRLVTFTISASLAGSTP
jgi:Tfp pilus assembly protein PilN